MSGEGKVELKKTLKRTPANQFDIRFHPWPGWPDNTPWCSRCTFTAQDDYERAAEHLVEQMHLYATSFRSEPHQIGEGYNNLVRMVAYGLRTASRNGVKALRREQNSTTSKNRVAKPRPGVI